MTNHCHQIVQQTLSRAGELGVDQALTFLREIDGINLRRRETVVDIARRVVGGDLSGARVAVLGASFKPNSDDIRDSPALSIASTLHGQGATVVVSDPVALANVAKKRPDLQLERDPYRAAAGAEVVLLLTEWDEFVGIDPLRLGEVVDSKNVIDGRNVLDRSAWRAAGWTYQGLGRS